MFTNMYIKNLPILFCLSILLIASTTECSLYQSPDQSENVELDSLEISNELEQPSDSRIINNVITDIRNSSTRNFSQQPTEQKQHLHNYTKLDNVAIIQTTNVNSVIDVFKTADNVHVSTPPDNTTYLKDTQNIRMNKKRRLLSFIFDNLVKKMRLRRSVALFHDQILNVEKNYSRVKRGTASTPLHSWVIYLLLGVFFMLVIFLMFAICCVYAIISVEKEPLPEIPNMCETGSRQQARKQIRPQLLVSLITKTKTDNLRRSSYSCPRIRRERERGLTNNYKRCDLEVGGNGSDSSAVASKMSTMERK